ncbi:hypothetical protein JOM56_011070, partial [Amanita muscaria]
LQCPLSTYAILLSEAFLRTAQAVLYTLAPVCSNSFVILLVHAMPFCPVPKRGNVLLYVLSLDQSYPYVVSCLS